jgi:Domain of unknown function (DUF4281)
MTNDQLFQLVNSMAMLAWLLLIIAPKWAWTGKTVMGLVITLFCIIYIYLISQSIKAEDFKSFSSLAGVMQLFTHEGAVLAGWVHYLAFDLMVGLFIVNDSQKNDLSHWLIIPCLLFTFMLGPVGLCLYLLMRLIKTKKYFFRYA